MICRSRDVYKEVSSVILITILVLLTISTLLHTNRLTSSKVLDVPRSNADTPWYEYLKSYTEEDSDDRFSISSYGITVTNQYRDDDSDYIYKDGGAGAYGDFALDFDLKATSMDMTTSQVWRGIICIFSDDAGKDWGRHEDNDDRVWGIAINYGDTGATWSLGILNIHNGDNNHGSTVSGLDLNTQYYCTLSKTGVKVTLTVYNDSDRTSVVGTTSHTLTADYSFNYFYAIASVSANGHYEWSGKLENFHFAGGIYVEDLASTDMILWTEVAYISNTTGNHKLEYDLDPSFESVDDVLWSNDTDTPQFFIPQSSYNINETVYYRVTISGYQDTGSFSYTSSPSDSVSYRLAFPQEAYKGGTHSPPGANVARIIWVDPVTGNWIIKKGTGNSVVFYQSSDRGLHWTQVGSTLSVDNDLPSGWVHITSGAEFAHDGTYYYLVLGGTHDSGRGSFIYRGTSLSDLTYQGKLCDFSSGFPHLSVNCRSHDLWYNETDGKMWFAVGGADDTKGSWDYVYKVCDTDGDLNLDDETPVLLFDVGDWSGEGWADGFVHPFNQLWWDWTNNRAMGAVVGCGSDTPDYDFESGLVFPTSPISSGGSPTYFYNSTTAEKGYFGWAFDTGGSASVGMTDINDACIVWENNGAMFAKMRESGIAGNPDPDKGDQWLGVV